MSRVTYYVILHWLTMFGWDIWMIADRYWLVGHYGPDSSSSGPGGVYV